MMKQKKGAILLAAFLMLTVLPGCSYAQGAARAPGKYHDRTEEAKAGGAMGDTQGAVIPEKLEYIPAGYEKPAEHQGKLEKLTYRTYESFSYKSREKDMSTTGKRQTSTRTTD